jgi:hypothetical protein
MMAFLVVGVGVVEIFCVFGFGMGMGILGKCFDFCLISFG